MQSDARKETNKKNASSELYVDGKFKEDREEWQKELQRHGEEVCADTDEARKVQEKRIEHFKKTGDLHFTDDGRGAEITIDLLFAAGGQRCLKTRSTDLKMQL